LRGEINTTRFILKKSTKRFSQKKIVYYDFVCEFGGGGLENKEGVRGKNREHWNDGI